MGFREDYQIIGTALVASSRLGANMKRYVILMAMALIVVLAACGGGSDDGGEVATADEFGQAWPFSVQSGEVDCIEPRLAVFTVDGTTYGLNPDAIAAGYPESEPIRIDNPAIPGVRLDLGTLISLAIRQC